MCICCFLTENCAFGPLDTKPRRIMWKLFKESILEAKSTKLDQQSELGHVHHVPKAINLSYRIVNTSFFPFDGNYEGAVGVEVPLHQLQQLHIQILYLINETEPQLSTFSHSSPSLGGHGSDWWYIYIYIYVCVCMYMFSFYR